MADGSIHRGAEVASNAIRLAISRGSFKASDVTQALKNEPPSKRTVTRILRQLQYEGWLRRESPNSSIWRAGTMCEHLGDMDEETLNRAEREPIGRK